MSVGVLASIVVGMVMDCAGLELAMTLTLALGFLHTLVLVWLGDHLFWMIFGFILYVFFRQFLFPVYIASLTHHLGYKALGLLSGIGFSISGITQLYMASVVTFVQGDCHKVTFLRNYGKDYDTCDTGYWINLHYLEILVLFLALLIPLFDRRERLWRENRIKEGLRRRSSWSTLYTGSDQSARSGVDYGSISEENALL